MTLLFHPHEWHTAVGVSVITKTNALTIPAASIQVLTIPGACSSLAHGYESTQVSSFHAMMMLYPTRPTTPVCMPIMYSFQGRLLCVPAVAGVYLSVSRDAAQTVLSNADALLYRPVNPI